MSEKDRQGLEGKRVPETEDEALKARLERLASALEDRRTREPHRTALDEASANTTGRAFSLGIRVLSEFIAGIIAGGGIGWLLDDWLGTRPVFLLVFMTLGIITGFWNVYRIAAKPTGPAGGGSQ
jgi:ATP synthase protein I